MPDITDHTIVFYLQTLFLDDGSVSKKSNSFVQSIYEKPIMLEDVREYSMLEIDTHHTIGGCSLDHKNRIQNQVSGESQCLEKVLIYTVSVTESNNQTSNEIYIISKCILSSL